MSNAEDFQAKLAEINAITDDRIILPSNIPVDVYSQEAENLYTWCQDDQTELTAKGLDWTLVEDIPVRAGALREAESQWNAVRFTRAEAQQQWAEGSQIAYDLRDELLHEFRFAFRNHPDIYERISAIAEDYGHADMIQDLNDLAVLGRAHPAVLTALNFDITRLDLAAQKADELAALLAASTADETYNETKKTRDKAYTLLKNAVDEVRSFGQYVYWRNDSRKQGYTSAYLRRKSKRRVSSSDIQEEQE